jgi:hypothetical protein
MKIRRVKKRDGREVPFDPAKIAAAVARAQAAVGEDDLEFAREVAQIVELALERRYAATVPEPVPGIEEIQDLVEKALIELGRAAAAKAYILYRDRRARVRDALVVDTGAHGSRSRTARRSGVDPGADESQPCGVDEAPNRAELRAPRVQFSDGLAAWSKGRIVAALMNEADLPRALAEEVAARVEERVFDSGYRRISTALIRELVDNELVELGLDQALQRQRVFGLARHDLRRRLDQPLPRAADGELAEIGVERALAGEILRRYALEDAMPDAVAELHLSGDLSIEDIERPHLPLWRALPCDLLLRGEPGPSSAFRVLEDVAEECDGCAAGIVLEDCGALVQALVRGRATAQGWLAQWLRASSAVARASGRRVDLCAGVGASNSLAERAVPLWIARLIEELAALDADGPPAFAPRLFIEVGELTEVLRSSPRLALAAERLIVAGRIVPTFGSSGETVVGPGLVRRARERGALTCAGAVAINLARLARRAGPWREDLLLEQISSLVQHAMSAMHALEDLQAGVRRERRGRVGYAIALVGLREALRWIGDGELRADQGARVLSFLGEASQRFGQASGLCVSVSPHFGERAAARFAALDAELFSTVQPLLFDTDEPPAPRAAYTSGFDLVGGEVLGAATAAVAPLLAVQRSGALHPPTLLASLSRARSSDAGDNSEPTRPRSGDGSAMLAALERLESARARLRGGGHALYALPREPEPAIANETRSIALFPESSSSPRSPSTSSLPHLSGTPHS